MDLNIEVKTIKELILSYIYDKNITVEEIVEAFFACSPDDYIVGLFIEKLQEIGDSNNEER